MATLTIAPAALASTPTPATTQLTAAQPATDCTWFASNGTNLGTIICEYGHTDDPELFPNGTLESFAIGTSHAVYTAWADTSGNWHTTSLGGYATSGVTVRQSGWALEILVKGQNGGTYCKFRGDTQTSGWSSDWSTSC
jgi:hypothetical protein